MKYLTTPKKQATLQICFKKNKKWFPKVVLIDFARHMWDKWVLHN